MNLKYINRKQTLGISHPADYRDWALTQDINLIGRVPSDRDYRLFREFKTEDMQVVTEWFDNAVSILGLDFEHQDAETTFYAKTIQSLNAGARRAGLLFYMMDLRPISELGNELEDREDQEILDKMVTECGCDPINPYWLKYSAEDGRQVLKVVFEVDVLPYNPSDAKPIGTNGLADQFLACFDDSVRFYGNNSFAPWKGKSVEKYRRYAPSKNLQSVFDVDFGLVVLDKEHIGFLLVTAEYL